MIKNIAIFLSFILLVACSTKQSTIQGTISNAEENSWLYLEKLTINDVQKVDSCQIKDNHFSFDYQADNINFYRISLTDKNYGLIALKKGDTIQFNAEAKSLVNFQASGSEEVEANSQLLNIINSLQPKTDSLRIVYQKSIGTTDEKIILERVREKYNFIMSEHKKDITQFINNRPSLFINLIAIQQLGDISNNIDIYKKVSQSLEKKYPNNIWVKNIREKVLSKESTSVGAIAPDFTINDINGTPFNLSSTQGSYVLLDFWASWCAPCRKENPLVVEMYKKYHAMGLEIIGISLDDTTQKVSAKEDWLKAIRKDGIEWVQLSELQGFKSNVCRSYDIESIPSTFLLDKNGVIIARDLRGTLLTNKLEEIFE